MLQAGFARVDITPPFGTKLTGYFALRVSDGILDPIELNALAITQGEDTAVIITGDFMYMTEAADTPIRMLIEKECGVAADHIIMQAIHQHTSTTPFSQGITDHLYDEWLKRKYCDVVKMALDDRKEAKLSIAAKETAQPISFVRRYRMKDGSCETNPKPCNPDILHPIGNADNTVRLVKFEREGANDIALIGFATHPDTVGGTKFSADWPGFARRMSERDLPGVSCILVNGCQGDTNHHDPNVPRRRDPDEKYAHTQKMGRLIADRVVELWNQTTPCADGPLTTEVKMNLLRTNTEGVEHIEECKAIMEKIQDGVPLPENITFASKATVRRIARLDTLMVFNKIPVSIIAFGKIALVGYGGEAFTQYADVLREAYPDLFILTACNANGAQGYFPSAEAFEEGGYEAQSSVFFPEIASTLQNVALEMLKKHVKGNEE